MPCGFITGYPPKKGGIQHLRLFQDGDDGAAIQCFTFFNKEHVAG